MRPLRVCPVLYNSWPPQFGHFGSVGIAMPTNVPDTGPDMLIRLAVTLPYGFGAFSFASDFIQ